MSLILITVFILKFAIFFRIYIYILFIYLFSKKWYEIVNTYFHVIYFIYIIYFYFKLNLKNRYQSDILNVFKSRVRLEQMCVLFKSQKNLYLN